MLVNSVTSECFMDSVWLSSIALFIHQHIYKDKHRSLRLSWPCFLLLLPSQKTNSEKQLGNYVQDPSSLGFCPLYADFLGAGFSVGLNFIGKAQGWVKRSSWCRVSTEAVWMPWDFHCVILSGHISDSLTKRSRDKVMHIEIDVCYKIFTSLLVKRKDKHLYLSYQKLPLAIIKHAGYPQLGTQLIRVSFPYTKVVGPFPLPFFFPPSPLPASLPSFCMQLCRVCLAQGPWLRKWVGAGICSSSNGHWGKVCHCPRGWCVFFYQ